MTRRVFVTTCTAASFAAMQTAASPLRALANAAVDKVSLTSIDMNGVTFSLQSHLIASRRVKLKSVHFDEMKLNGMPFSLSGIGEKLRFAVGRSVVMPSVLATLLFRDVSSLKPLEQAIRNEKVYVTGKAHVELDLNFAEKFFSGYSSGAAEVDLAGELPVLIPGGDAGRVAVLASLKGAETILGLAGSALSH